MAWCGPATLDDVDGRGHRPALLVSEHHHQRRTQVLDSVLDAGDDGSVGHVAGHPDGEQIAEALVEDELWRHPRIGAAKNDGDRVLAPRDGGAPLDGLI